jgi:hypothetical protein
MLNVSLVPWNEEHFPVLRACNTGEMTRHLGRAETNDELLERHGSSPVGWCSFGS